MKKIALATFLFAMAVPGVAARPIDVATDVAAPIRQALDGFNAGDMKAFFAMYAFGEITIVDEFAPHRWTGPHAAKTWADDYIKHAAATV